MSATGRKVTIRMPESSRLLGAEVAALHVAPGGVVHEGSLLMTLRAQGSDHVVRAPRPGRAVPLVTTGDELMPGDPVLILNVDESALKVAKRREHRTMLGLGVTEMDRARGGATDTAAAAMDHETLGEALRQWLQPVLALAICAMAAFMLLPFFSHVGAGASTGELVAMGAIAVVVAGLIALFVLPAHGRWPRLTVQFVALSWLVLAGGVLFTQTAYAPGTAVAGGQALYMRSDGVLREEAFGGDGGIAMSAGLVPAETDFASTLRVGQTDLVPMPRVTAPGRMASRRDRVARPGVRVVAWAGVAPGRSPGDRVGAPVPTVTPVLAKAEDVAPRTGPGIRLAAAPALPGDLPDPAAPGLLRLAAGADADPGAPVVATAAGAMAAPTGVEPTRGNSGIVAAVILPNAGSGPAFPVGRRVGRSLPRSRSCSPCAGGAADGRVDDHPDRPDGHAGRDAAHRIRRPGDRGCHAGPAAGFAAGWRPVPGRARRHAPGPGRRAADAGGTRGRC